MTQSEWFEKLTNPESDWAWLLFFAAATVLTVVAKSILYFVAARLRVLAERTVSQWDDVGVDLIEKLKSLTLFVWFFYSISKVARPDAHVHKYFLIAVVAITSLQIIVWGRHVIRSWRKIILKKKIEEDPSSAAALDLTYVTVQSLLIVFVVLMGMSQLGINIGALLAGLGVGGIAVALAAQNVLGDLLASLSIVLDKPFVMGDFIVAGNEKGTIEHIGIKTTRLRSLSGEELIFSNKDLLESRLHNFKRMWKRRVVQQFGVVYSTPADVVEKIPHWVTEIIKKYDKVEFDRCHFAAYGGSSLDFEFVFFINDPEYNVFMDYQQKILLDIFRKFAAEKVDFAFPSQSLYIEKWPPVKKAELSQ